MSLSVQGLGTDHATQKNFSAQAQPKFCYIMYSMPPFLGGGGVDGNGYKP